MELDGTARQTAAHLCNAVKLISCCQSESSLLCFLSFQSCNLGLLSVTGDGKE
jgi:hypothetical protein